MSEDIKSANERNITRMLENQSRLLESRKAAKGGLAGGAYAPIPGSRAASTQGARAGDDTTQGAAVAVEPAGRGTRRPKPAIGTANTVGPTGLPLSPYEPYQGEDEHPSDDVPF